MVRITELHKVEVGMPNWQVTHRQGNGKTTFEEFDSKLEAEIYAKMLQFADDKKLTKWKMPTERGN